MNIFPWRSFEILPWDMAYFVILCQKIGYLSGNSRFFSETSGCHNVLSRKIPLLRERPLVMEATFTKKYFDYFWYTPKRHTIC